MMENKDVCVITGGGSGMGFEAARCMPKQKIIVISGRTVSRLEHAACQLREEGHDVYLHACDVSKRESVRELAAYAASLGTVKNVIHCAGVSPQMAEAEQLLCINALGTVYMNEEFAKVMEAGSVIVDVSSNAAYSIPSFMKIICRYEDAVKNENKFLHHCMTLVKLMPSEYTKKGLAYAVSKSFVCWYAKRFAFELGPKGIRVVSLSPGLVATDMGELEKEKGARMIERSAQQRMGRPEELGYALATLADERNGFLTGVDILCDGGSTGSPRRTGTLAFLRVSKAED